MIRSAIAASLALALAACAGSAPAPNHTAAPARPEARSYAVTPDAMGDVDAALARAAASGKRVLLVMGGNWCHDSRALAGWLETPRFAALVAERFELVFVNIGMPQTGDGHNLAVPRRFGLENVPGTPALLVLTAQGQAVNLDTAASWRNAASRSEDAIYDELVALSGAPATPQADAANASGLRDKAGAKIWIGSDDKGCRYALAQDGPWLREWSQLEGTDEGTSVQVRADGSTDWKCISATIYELQKRFPTVGFVSTPDN